MIQIIKSTRIAYHLLFWMLFLVYQLTNSVSNKSLVGDYWWGDWKILHVLLVGVVFKAIFAYGFVYYLVPAYLDRKRYALFGGLTFLWFYMVLFGYTATYYYHLEELYTVYMWHDKESLDTLGRRLTSLPFILNYFSNFIFPAIVLGAIKFYKRRVLLAQVEEEKNRMELQVLKNQLNPHFLFNALSSIQNLVVQQDNQTANTYLNKLSRLLRKV
ncbi:MAG: histidine kinase, partial [Bacteroidota bacterium]